MTRRSFGSPLPPDPVTVTRRSFGSPLPPDPVTVTRRSFGSPPPPDPVTSTRRSFGSPLPPDPVTVTAAWDALCEAGGDEAEWDIVERLVSAYRVTCRCAYDVTRCRVSGQESSFWP